MWVWAANPIHSNKHFLQAGYLYITLCTQFLYRMVIKTANTDSLFRSIPVVMKRTNKMTAVHINKPVMIVFYDFFTVPAFPYCKLKWKLRTSHPFWYNGFTTKHIYSQKKGKVLWWNYITLGARNATIIHFIVTAKIQMVTKSISAETAVINLPPPTSVVRVQIVGRNIRLHCRSFYFTPHWRFTQYFKKFQ